MKPTLGVWFGLWLRLAIVVLGFGNDLKPLVSEEEAICGLLGTVGDSTFWTSCVFWTIQRYPYLRKYSYIITCLSIIWQLQALKNECNIDTP